MRWSKRSPGARSRFAWLVCLDYDPRALTVAVAHLFLVRLIAQVAHVWRIRGGRAVKFQQYLDTLQVARDAGAF
jgi:hypothetical protein